MRSKKSAKKPRTSESTPKMLRTRESPLKKLRISGSHRVSLEEPEFWTHEKMCTVAEEDMSRLVEELDWLLSRCAICGDGICMDRAHWHSKEKEELDLEMVTTISDRPCDPLILSTFMSDEKEWLCTFHVT